MKVFIDTTNWTIIKTVNEIPVLVGDNYTDKIQVLYNANPDSLTDTNFYPTLNILKPNGRKVGPFSFDSLEENESYPLTYTDDDNNTWYYFDFTLSSETGVLNTNGRFQVTITTNLYTHGTTIIKGQKNANIQLNVVNATYNEDTNVLILGDDPSSIVANMYALLQSLNAAVSNLSNTKADRNNSSQTITAGTINVDTLQKALAGSIQFVPGEGITIKFNDNSKLTINSFGTVVDGSLFVGKWMFSGNTATTPVANTTLKVQNNTTEINIAPDKLEAIGGASQMTIADDVIIKSTNGIIAIDEDGDENINIRYNGEDSEGTLKAYADVSEDGVVLHHEKKVGNVTSSVGLVMQQSTTTLSNNKWELTFSNDDNAGLTITNKTDHFKLLHFDKTSFVVDTDNITINPGGIGFSSLGAYIGIPYNILAFETNKTTSSKDLYVNSDQVATHSYTTAQDNVVKAYADSLNTAMNTRVTAIENTLATDITAFDTLEEIATYLQEHTSDYTELVAEVQANTNAIADLESEETGIAAAEAIRVTNENTRISNENARISAENQRIANENARIAAETARQAGYDQMDDRLDAVEAAVDTINNTSLPAKQDLIDSTHKLSSDLVDDTNATNKFVTASDKANWNAKQDALSGSTSIDITSNVVSVKEDYITSQFLSNTERQEIIDEIVEVFN